MAIQPMALQVQNPQIDTMNALGKGMQARQAFDQNNITLAKQGLETIGSIALGAMGGKLDGEADPAIFEQGLDLLEQNGVKVDAFRGRPDVAPMVARASMTALQQLGVAQDERTYELAMKKFEQDLAQAATAPKTSLNLAYGQDAQGNVVPLQPRDDGTMVQTQMPDGVTLATKSDKIDLGTEWGILDPLTRQVVARVPKDNFGEAYDTKFGAEQASIDAAKPANQVKAEGALASLDTKNGIVLDKIDQALDSSGFWTTGVVGNLTSAVPGSPAYDLARTLDTIKANIGFEELQTMRDNSPTGGALGSITERELAFLQSTIASIEQAQSETQLRENLQILRDFVASSQDRRRAAYDATFGAQGGVAPAPSTPAASSAPAPASSQSMGEGTIIENDAGERMVLRNGNWEAM